MKKYIFILMVFMSVLSVSAVEWEGTYVTRGGQWGIIITRYNDAGGYVVQKVEIRDNQVTHKWETQRAFVPFFEGREMYFSWMTGRQFQDDPDSNELIVYRIRRTGLVYSGVYFSPEISTRELTQQFVKLDNP